MPENIAASSEFKNVVRSSKTVDFSVLEPVQMWTDLLSSGVDPAKVTLLCLGGGEISAQELGLAWALGARTAALAGDAVASRRFALLLANAGSDSGRG